jgi:hypothetical protein
MVVGPPIGCGCCAHAPAGSVEHESLEPLLLLPLLPLLLPPELLELLELLDPPELLEPEPDEPPDDELPGPTPFVLPPHAPAAADKRSGMETTNAA